MNRQNETTAPTRSGSAFFGFLLTACAALGTLAFIAAHAPPRMKLIGLFSIAVGAASGAIIAFLGERFVLSRMMIVGSAILLVPVVMAGYAAESFRTWKAARVAHVLAQPGGKTIIEQLESGETPSNPAEAILLDAYRPHVRPKVSIYLVERLQGVAPDVTMSGAITVAIGELVFGYIAGIATASRLSSQRKSIAPEAAT